MTVVRGGPTVICISGKAQHGKDTLALFLKSAFEHGEKRVRIIHYGDLVKYICRELFDWNGEKDTSGRTLLQNVGTGMVRNREPDYWVNFVIDMLVFFGGNWDYVLIPDCRFPNEIDRIEDAGYKRIHINVFRPNFDNGLTEEQKMHQSETALDDHPADYEVLNCYGFRHLQESAEAIVEELLG